MCRHGFECKDCSFHKQMLDSAYKLVEAESDRYYHRGHAWVRDVKPLSLSLPPPLNHRF